VNYALKAIALLTMPLQYDPPPAIHYDEDRPHRSRPTASTRGKPKGLICRQIAARRGEDSRRKNR
jgi:hypothetical protein